MSAYIKAIHNYLLKNPNLGKQAIVELLRQRFPQLSDNEAWIIVAGFFNKGIEFRIPEDLCQPKG